MSPARGTMGHETELTTVPGRGPAESREPLAFVPEEQDPRESFQRARARQLQGHRGPRRAPEQRAARCLSQLPPGDTAYLSC